MNLDQMPPAPVALCQRCGEPVRYGRRHTHLCDSCRAAREAENAMRASGTPTLFQVRSKGGAV
jgi:hypothetical protein